MIQFCAPATKYLIPLSINAARLLLALWFTCSLLPPPPVAHAQQRFTVVATTSIIADTARSIAGDTARVESLMGAGVDPHLYKASPGDLRKLSNASLILYNGLHLEGKIADILEKLGQRKPVVAVAHSIPSQRLRPLTPGAELYDPHVWFDVSLWIEASRTIAKALGQHDPLHASEYSKRAEDLVRSLATLHEWCRTELARIPKAHRILITAHDAFAYFGRAYDVEVLGIQGVNTDSEASLREINNLVQLIVERRIPAVFVESTISPKTIQALVEGSAARGHQVTVGGQLYSDALGEPGTPAGTYIGMVRHNVQTITSALQSSHHDSTTPPV